MKMSEIPADAVPSTTGCVLVTLRSQMPSLWPTYSLTSWHTARDVVALKLDTIWRRQQSHINTEGNHRHVLNLTGFLHISLLIFLSGGHEDGFVVILVICSSISRLLNFKLTAFFLFSFKLRTINWHFEGYLNTKCQWNCKVLYQNPGTSIYTQSNTIEYEGFQTSQTF